MSEWISLEFVVFAVSMTVIAYPFFGAILYGDPWTWIFEDPTDPPTK